MSDQIYLEVIHVKLDSLTEITKTGFARMEGRIDAVEKEVNDLRIWRAGIEESQREEKSSIDWAKIVLGMIALVAAALAIVSQVVG